MATFKLKTLDSSIPSSFDLSNPFSQVLHVECSFEPEGIARLQSKPKPKSILCPDSTVKLSTPGYATRQNAVPGYPDLPRTHSPISASELSRRRKRASEFESERDEAKCSHCFSSHDEDPQADLKTAGRGRRERRPLLWEVRA